MYFWDINGLKDELINYKLSERSVFLYIFIFILYAQGSFVFNFFRYYGKETGFGLYGDLLFYIFFTAITAIGIYYSYYCNGKNEGERFAVKFISLSWVVTLRYLVFLLVSYFIILLFLTFLASTQLIEKKISKTLIGGISFILIIFLPFWIYYRIGYHIKDINRRIKERTIS